MVEGNPVSIGPGIEVVLPLSILAANTFGHFPYCIDIEKEEPSTILQATVKHQAKPKSGCCRWVT